MKNKKIIIGMLCVVIITGTIAGAVYALELGVASEPKLPFTFEPAVDNAVLAKDDPSIDVYLPETFMIGDEVHYYDHTEEEKEYLIGQEKVHQAVIDAKAELGVNIGINESDCGNMTKEQIKIYVYLRDQSKKSAPGNFPRIRKVSLGEMPYNAERLTVEALDDIISQSSSFTDLLIKLQDKYGTQDYIDFSFNVTAGIIEYWLDDYGDKVISFDSYFDEKSISLHTSDSDVTKLYSNEELDAIFAAAK